MSRVRVRQMRAALVALVSTIEATGGIEVDNWGASWPLADEDWADLADAYELACRALRRPVKAVHVDEVSAEIGVLR